jgi:CrcB protein
MPSLQLVSLLAVLAGGAIGSAARWWVGLRLNGLFSNLPLGTLAVNLVGGFVIGAAMAFFVRMPAVDPEWRLFVMTGLCGGFTTFSAFSAEVITMLQAGRVGWAATTITVHVSGSLLLTFLGFVLVHR